MQYSKICAQEQQEQEWEDITDSEISEDVDDQLSRVEYDSQINQDDLQFLDQFDDDHETKIDIYCLMEQDGYNEYELTNKDFMELYVLYLKEYLSHKYRKIQYSPIHQYWQPHTQKDFYQIVAHIRDQQKVNSNQQLVFSTKEQNTKDMDYIEYRQGKNVEDQEILEEHTDCGFAFALIQTALRTVQQNGDSMIPQDFEHLEKNLKDALKVHYGTVLNAIQDLERSPRKYVTLQAGICEVEMEYGHTIFNYNQYHDEYHEEHEQHSKQQEIDLGKIHEHAQIAQVVWRMHHDYLKEIISDNAELSEYDTLNKRLIQHQIPHTQEVKKLQPCKLFKDTLYHPLEDILKMYGEQLKLR